MLVTISGRIGAVVLAGALAAGVLPGCGDHRDDRMHRHHGMVDHGEMMSMLHRGREQAEEAREESERVAQRLAEAEQSADPERMRAAIAEAREALERIDTHLESCATTMAEVERMHRDSEMPMPEERSPEPRRDGGRY